MSISLEKAKETTNGSSHRTVRKHRLNRSPIQIESKWIKDVPYTLFPSFNKNRSLSPLKKQKQLRIAKSLENCWIVTKPEVRFFNLVTFIHHAQRNKLPTPYCAYTDERKELIKKTHGVWKSKKKVSFNIVICEQSELLLHFEWTKGCFKNEKNGPFWNSVTRVVIFSGEKCEKMPKLKWDILGSFQTVCNGQKVVSDTLSVDTCQYEVQYIGKKWWKMAKLKNDIFSKFQTLCNHWDIVGDF